MIGKNHAYPRTEKEMSVRPKAFNTQFCLVLGHRGRARRIDGRRLRHVLRNLAAVRPGGHPVHPVRRPVGFPRRTRTTATNSQAQQVQDHQHGHPHLQRRSMLLRGRTGRPDQGLLCSQGEPSGRDSRAG